MYTQTHMTHLINNFISRLTIKQQQKKKKWKKSTAHYIRMFKKQKIRYQLSHNARLNYYLKKIYQTSKYIISVYARDDNRVKLKMNNIFHMTICQIKWLITIKCV